MPDMKKIMIAVIGTVTLFASCKKDIDQHNTLNAGDFSDRTATLKDAADFPINTAINYGPMTTETKFADIVKRDFDGVTLGYEMKHGAIVQNNGTYNYANADALIAAVGSMNVFGHTLAWHANQNATFIKSFSGLTIPAPAELATNPGFESGLTGWSVFNTNGATISATNVAAEVRTGTGAMKVVNPNSNTGSQWKVQVSSSAFATTPGTQYNISYWVKAGSAGGSIRLSTGPTAAQYQGDQTIGTAWQQVTWTITASLSSTTFLFDMGQVANTYYIDDVSVKEVVAAPSGPQIVAKLDQAFGDFITNMVNHFKTKVHEWDVVNECLSPSGAFRTSGNSSDIANLSAPDIFVWSDYFGRDYALKAFTYAKAADPTATFFINEYGLESSSVKTDSLIALVNELKTKGAKVDGIGTQMHVTWNTSRDGIDQMFIKLAATGLKVRVSELDVKMFPNGSAASTPTPTQSAYQAEMYRYIVASYIKNVPATQRAGITVWGVNDKNSWLYNSGKEYPLLYDDNYEKKAAYAGFLEGLKQ